MNGEGAFETADAAAGCQDTWLINRYRVSETGKHSKQRGGGSKQNVIPLCEPGQATNDSKPETLNLNPEPSSMIWG